MERAFYNCSSLTSVTIGNSVTSIGYMAFSHCSSLTSVTIGNSVTSIGNYAFENCSLDSLVFESETPATLGFYPLSYTNNCPLIVPCSAVDDYKTAWSDYADRITCSGTTTDMETVENTESSTSSATKLIRDGQIYILRNNKTFTITGQEVK